MKDPNAPANIVGAITGSGPGGATTLVVKLQDVFGDNSLPLIRMETFNGIADPNDLTPQHEPSWETVLTLGQSSELAKLLLDGINRTRQLDGAAARRRYDDQHGEPS
jgi:hypothetical protein